MPPKKEGHIYDLQETFARLRQTLPILDDLDLPYEIRCYLHLIRVWCDEWEDLGIPFTPAFECLKGGEVESQRILLMRKMIRAFHLLTGRKGTSCKCCGCRGTSLRLSICFGKTRLLFSP